MFQTTLEATQRRWIGTTSFFLLTHQLHINRRVQLPLSLFLTAYLWFLPVLATEKPPLYALSILVVAYGHAYWRYGINPFAQIDSDVSLAGRIARVAFVTIGHCWSDSLVGRLWLVRFPVIFFYDLEIKAYWTFILVPLAYKLRLQRVLEWFQVEVCFLWRLGAGGVEWDSSGAYH